jgi:hypothetical protein
MRTSNAVIVQVDPATLNLVDGHAGTIVNRIDDHVNHERETTKADTDTTRNKA